MIRASNGMVSLSGDEMELLADFTGIIKGMKEMLKEHGYDDEGVADRIAYAGKIAFMSEEELYNEAKKKINEFEELKGELN